MSGKLFATIFPAVTCQSGSKTVVRWLASSSRKIGCLDVEGALKLGRFYTRLRWTVQEKQQLTFPRFSYTRVHRKFMPDWCKKYIIIYI